MGPSASHRRRTTSMPSSKIGWFSSNDTLNGRYSRRSFPPPPAKTTPPPPNQSSVHPPPAHRHGRGQPNVSRPGRNIGQHQVGTGQHAERAEVVFTDPRGVHPEFFRVKRLCRDVGHKLVRSARVVQVVIVAQREIAEVHGSASYSIT